MAIDPDTWLDLIGDEYFADFIPAGGGSVRFAVTPGQHTQLHDRLADGLRALAQANGLEVVACDVAMVRLHMLQNVVFALARALPWPQLLQRRLEMLIAGAGYHVPGDRPYEDHWPTLAELAAANGVAAHLLRRDLTQAMSREIWQDRRLTQDFRNAMIALLEARLTGEDASLAGAVMEWLGGTLRSTAPLKAARIGRRIGRQNARATLMSLCHWVRSCDGRGVLLLLDIRRLHRERKTVTEGLVYTPAAVMDCYEVLRQMIDDAEQFPGLFVAALADDAFLSEDPRRSLGQYAALQMRIWDDVRPQGGDNPLAPLVRIAA
jgi:hypothetical protein